MGSKIDGFVALADRTRGDDPVGLAAHELIELLWIEDAPANLFESADTLQHIRQAKDMLKAASEAVNERHEEVSQRLYNDMVEQGMQNFSRNGLSFYLTTERFVQANKELGGTSNPDLVEWLESNELGDIAKRNVNAQSLRSAVNEWLKDNPVEAVVDGDELDGDDLLTHLGLKAGEYKDRTARREALLELVILSEKPKVGIRKADK